MSPRPIENTHSNKQIQKQRCDNETQTQNVNIYSTLQKIWYQRKLHLVYGNIRDEILHGMILGTEREY